MSYSNKKKLTPLKRGKGKKEDGGLSASLSFSMIDQLQDQLADYEKNLTSAGKSNGGAPMAFGMSGFSNQDSGAAVPATDMLESTLNFMDLQPPVSATPTHHTHTPFSSCLSEN